MGVTREWWAQFGAGGGIDTGTDTGGGIGVGSVRAVVAWPGGTVRVAGTGGRTTGVATGMFTGGIVVAARRNSCRRSKVTICFGD